MKKLSLLLVLALVLGLCGCRQEAPSSPSVGAVEETAETAPETTEAVRATVPEDGDPNDVTCKGSYTGTADSAPAAVMGEETLTNQALQVWYWAEVAQYREEGHPEAPDFNRPLDTQVCTIDDSVASWQQYFLREALNAWHTAAALRAQSQQLPMPREEAYQPNMKNQETYMTGMPASDYLYGYSPLYRMNTLHKEYLDAVPQMLQKLAEQKGYESVSALAKNGFGASEKELKAYAELMNYAYMYFTDMSYYIEPDQETLDAFCAEYNAQADGHYVDIRHILLVPEDLYQEPEKDWSKRVQELILLEEVQVAQDGTVTCSEAAWDACMQKAQEMLTGWEKDVRSSEATFAELANKQSDDKGTALDGGAYHRIAKGQLLDVLDDWCFAPGRQAGDTGIVRSPYGVHVLYFAGRVDADRAEAEDAYYRQEQAYLMIDAREAHPMKVNYSNIVLEEAEGTVAAGEILYPDIAHERFPEVPLYLQQDYPKTMYGGFKITTNGCGITTMAMLASYMTDDELTPPEMCARYGRYSHANGTDGMIFIYEPPVMGFYLREKTYDTRVAKAALEEGQIVISIQHPGYWTRGGHYIVCESINEEGLVQVRDSNIYNYVRVPAHKDDLHKWGNITAAGSGYWIYEDKVTAIPACARCGDPQGATEQLLQQDYCCHKCTAALMRRNTYLEACREE